MFEPVGAIQQDTDRYRFTLWAPRAETVDLVLFPTGEEHRLARQGHGYFEGELSGVSPLTRYGYRLDGGEILPDPASRRQPDGVHGPSALDHPGGQRDVTDGGIRTLAEYVYYEIHIGTATPEGTFEAAIGRLAELAELGVTAVELMPVASFPGRRNWGYDGVFPWAVQESYGAASGLRRFVSAAHALDLSVVLDVVMNHLGPEGNVLPKFAPYFHPEIRTPWGPAMNLDGPGSDEVRRYWGGNALHWFDEFHIDALRLDAVHALLDRSAVPFLTELAHEVGHRNRTADRPGWLIAESDLNDARLLHPPNRGGMGLHAQWADDFHHALHAVVTGERSGYYADFGSIADLAVALARPYVYDGRFSLYRNRRHGNSPEGLPAWRFVSALQNHDQIGNRLGGERLATLVPYELLKTAVALHLLAPWRPLLFQGEEVASQAPFWFFTDHSDSAVIKGLREGRAREFAAFGWSTQVPDPQDPRYFEESRWDSPAARSPHARTHRALVRELLRLRRAVPALDSHASLVALACEQEHSLAALRELEGDRWGWLVRWKEGGGPTIPFFHEGHWRIELDTAASRWDGPDECDRDGTLATPPTLEGLAGPRLVLLHAEE
jgi:maltooligosyltrehalose trehalohydrolase